MPKMRDHYDFSQEGHSEVGKYAGKLDTKVINIKPLRNRLPKTLDWKIANKRAGDKI